LKKLLLDTGILSDFVNARRNIHERLAEESLLGIRVGTCTPAIAEVTAGIESSATRDRNMSVFLKSLKSIRIWAFDDKAAYMYGSIYAALRRKGRPMQSMDVMIAAVAMSLGDCKVLTTDSDLLAIDGLDAEVS
jgi:tRNA(fMet)-specific endonuclease VapC